MPYVEVQSLLDEDYPDGWRYYWKSANLDALGDDVLEVLDRQAATAPSHHSTIDVWYHGGALDRVDPEATAFGERPAYLIGVEANWEPASRTSRTSRGRARPSTRSSRSRAAAAYLNFPGFFEEGAEQLRASYGERNYERLVALKTELDPANLFAVGGERSGASPARLDSRPTRDPERRLR